MMIQQATHANIIIIMFVNCFPFCECRRTCKSRGLYYKTITIVNDATIWGVNYDRNYLKVTSCYLKVTSCYLKVTICYLKVTSHYLQVR
jgi:hypothetical protein